MNNKSQSLNSTQLIESVSENTGLDKRDVRRVVKTLIERISVELARGNAVTLTGLGRLRTAGMKARKIRDIKTHELINVGEIKTVRFKASESLKERINS